eukprot:SAG11_NODE_50_length_19992_cov_9.945157_10_plen_63_part_00
MCERDGELVGMGQSDADTQRLTPREYDLPKQTLYLMASGYEEEGACTAQHRKRAGLGRRAAA